jgi:membrane protein YqaA with SNARE-associated domain
MGNSDELSSGKVMGLHPREIPGAEEQTRGLWNRCPDGGFRVRPAPPSFHLLSTLPIASVPLRVPERSPWILPGIMLLLGLAALIVAEAAPSWAGLAYFVPFTFLGNSLAPLPYDGAVVYLGARYPLWVIVPIGVAATLLIEAWNIELLTRMLARDGSRAFRNHKVTQWSLRWYRKAPFWSLVLTCVLPIVPHYPMRFLAVLAAYPLWKYQLSVTLGRGARYSALVLIGTVLPIPGRWIVVASLVILALGVRGARRMNHSPAPPVHAASPEARTPDEA